MTLPIEEPDYFTCLEDVQKDSPEHVLCGFCGGPNEKWDDCGFFYKTRHDGAYVASCGCVPVNTAER